MGTARGAAVAILLAAAVVLFRGCAYAPPMPEEPGGEPRFPSAESPRGPYAGAPSPREPAPPPAFPDRFRGRPVRVLLGGEPRPDVEIDADGEIRCWDSRGTLLRGEAGRVSLSAEGERIRFGNGAVVDSPVDLASASGLRVWGKKVSGRVRISARQWRLSAVAVVPLEEYVAAVVSREASPKFHEAALAAIAVAVRTYALWSMEKPKGPTHDVVAGVEDQVFEGMDGVARDFRRAAEATKGEILAWQGGIANVAYHSTCGGRTENAKDAWGTDVPYLRSVPCEDCRQSPAYRWDIRMTRKEAVRVALALGVRSEGELSMEIAGRSSTGRASRIRISAGGVFRETAASAFRKAAGYSRVKSLKMEIVPSGNGWAISGQGYGHGVGMCQWGADGMAAAGRNFREILARYYPGTALAGEDR